MLKAKAYFDRLMRDKKNGFLDEIVKAGLYLISLPFGLVVRAWDACFKLGVLKSYKADIPVVSVGNITVGGSGKTPIVIILAKALSLKGLKPVVLTRGYGKDEVDLLKKKMPIIPVISARDRVKSAKEAGSVFSADMVILDDGYQHRRLDRDMDILLVDASNPFGNNHMVPRGILREPVGSMKRADVIILTKADYGKENLKGLKTMIKGRFPDKQMLEAVYVPDRLTNVMTNSKMPFEAIKGKKICMVSGIADPGYFRHILSGLGAQIALEFDFIDHVTYTAGALESVLSKAKDSGCMALVMTEKDAVKIREMEFDAKGMEIYAVDVLAVIKENAEGLLEKICGFTGCETG